MLLRNCPPAFGLALRESGDGAFLIFRSGRALGVVSLPALRHRPCLVALSGPSGPGDGAFFRSGDGAFLIFPIGRESDQTRALKLAPLSEVCSDSYTRPGRYRKNGSFRPRIRYRVVGSVPLNIIFLQASCAFISEQNAPNRIFLGQKLTSL